MTDLRWAGLAVAVGCVIGLIALIQLSPQLRRGTRASQPSTDVKREDPNCCQVCGRAVPLLTAADIGERPWPGDSGWLVNTSEHPPRYQFATRVCRDCWSASEDIEAAWRRDAEEVAWARTQEAAAWLADAPVIDVPSHDLRAVHGWEVLGTDN